MRFYVSPEYIFPEKKLIEIRDREELHHIRDVMRLGEGTRVTIFDGQGKEYSGHIKGINRRSAIISIRNIKEARSDVSYSVTLYQAIPKKSKMAFIIEKAVELGVDTIVPIVTERTIPRIDSKALSKIERWRRIATSASKQSGRIRLPEISKVIDFKKALSESKKSGQVIFAALDETKVPLKTLLQAESQKDIAIFVGPEGDFSPGEISMAKDAGYSICSLGSLVLRVETAAIYILSCLSYEYR
ncbi:MAG: 16S rRNA (uracil(1498)-N(3))-methyltransferase [Candidatus Omnitrophota bacterium]|nr:16S rRNA (uracil(1498)-N(3))-methyltransferase [Candidatus Omnitrophota bacterium]